MAKFEHVLALLVKAQNQLEEALAAPITEPRDLAGIIKSFEFVFELSWKCIQAAAAAEGTLVNSPRKAFTEAFRLEWIDDSVVWAEILEDRNRTVHTYDEAFALQMVDRIRTRYVIPFACLVKTLVQLRSRGD